MSQSSIHKSAESLRSLQQAHSQHLSPVCSRISIATSQTGDHEAITALSLTGMDGFLQQQGVHPNLKEFKAVPANSQSPVEYTALMF